ncbi:hypothetical protein COLO4_20816 [Corchorus olitorius]|uniref:Uncharacterized protein n=1 Tax=Corchorus olitorius TaxID=93759 RepID=A0A1R3IWX8_9ROSI|nr:hypothetical protein COLO4_20816 [Corchorus olitorius]
MAAENQRILRENSASHGNPREDPSSQGNCIENTSSSRPNPLTQSPNNNNEDDLNVAISSQGGNSNNSNGPTLDHHKTVVTIVDQNGERKMVKTTTKLLFAAAHPQGRAVVPSNGKGQPIGGEGKLLVGVLGRIARTGSMCPINYESWHKMPHDLKVEALRFVESAQA